MSERQQTALPTGAPPSDSEQDMWRAWDPSQGPWQGSTGATIVYDGGRYFPAFTLPNVGANYYSDDSDDDYVLGQFNMEHLQLDDPPEQDIWREDYLEFVLAQRACATRRLAAGLPPTACTRHTPCDDCIFHPGATATSVHWQCMDDARLRAELESYLRERSPDAPAWMPPSPTSERRRLRPPRLLFGQVDASRDRSAYDAPSSNQASPASSVRSEPSSSPPASSAPSNPSAPSCVDRPVFGPPRPPPTYEELSD